MADTTASRADAVPAVKGCGKSCMGPCCLPGSVLPLYCFEPRTSPPGPGWGQGGGTPFGSTSDLSTCSSTPPLEGTSSEDSSGSESSGEDLPQNQRRSFLDSLITSLWDERVEEGLFRYSVADCQTRVIPGKIGFVAQYNEGRHMKKRPTEFSMDAVLQNFDKSKFNFTKVGQREALFAFEEASASQEQQPTLTPLSALFHEGAIVAPNAGGPNVVAINVSPIEYGHVLLIPRIHGAMAQKMDPSSLLLALTFAAEVGSPFFRIGYNSLGAFATVNHLHFQGYYLRRPFAVEHAAVSAPIWGPKEGGGGTSVRELENYPVRGLAYSVGESLEETARIVGAACEVLQSRNVPFNMFISGCGSKIFLWPQCYAERQALGEVESELLETQVNPAVFEISGHMVMKRREDFSALTEDVAGRLLAAVSLSEGRFAEIRALCLQAASAAVSV